MSLKCFFRIFDLNRSLFGKKPPLSRIKKNFDMMESNIVFFNSGYRTCERFSALFLMRNLPGSKKRDRKILLDYLSNRLSSSNDHEDTNSADLI